jgi:DNA-binding SARP family transcriptional activator
MAHELRFRLLGPVEVESAGRAVPINAARHRAVLAMLLLSANRHVPRDVLIDRIWNGVPPDGAVKTLQSYVSRLRTLLGGAIEAGRDGRSYRLVADPAAVDASLFADLVAEGRAALERGDPAGADAAFTRALGLWRDRPLADLAGEYRFADEAARRYEALRVDAVEGAFQAAGALGPLAGRADDLGAAVARHPDRAVLRELHLRALYEAGRQDDALAAYGEYRRERRDRGLDPEPAVDRLHRRILRQDPALAPAPGVPPGFVGRVGPLSRLRTAWQAAAAGRGRCVLLHGEAGIGKTWLVNRIADEVLAAGGLVASGSPHDATGPSAFRPWRQVLEMIGADGAVAPDREQQFGAVVAALRRASAVRPLLVLLDDVHEADAGSVKLLSYVVRLLPGTRILLVAVARDPADGPPAVDWPEAADRLRRLPGVESLRLGPFDDGEIAQLVSYEIERPPDPELLAAVTGRAGGNPLFAVELTRLLADERALARLRRTGRLPGVPPVVRDAVRRRAHGLPARCRAMLALAAVLGMEFELAVLAADPAAGGDDLDALVHLAIGQRFVEEVRPGVLYFGHPLVHEAIYDDIPRHQRERLHARAIAAIERVHHDRLDAHAERLAHHWLQIAGAQARRNAAAYAVRASRQAAGMLAWEDAARLRQVALDLDDRGDPAATAELLLDLGDLLVRAGEFRFAGERYLEALALAPPPDLFLRGALGFTEGATYFYAASADHAVRLLEQALAMVGDTDPALRARILAGLGAAMVWETTGHTDTNRARRDARTAEAIRLAREARDRRVLTRALSARVGAIWRQDNAAERMALADDLVALAEATGEHDLHSGITGQILLYHHDLGRLPTAAGDPAALEPTLLVHQGRVAQHTHLWRLGTAAFLVDTGRPAEARELFADAVASLDEVPPSAHWLCTMTLAADLCTVFADADAADRIRDRLLPYAGQHGVITYGFGAVGSVAHFLGQVAGVLGDWKEADNHFQFAVEANRRLGAPPLVARTQLEYGRMLVNGGQSGERERADVLLAAAAATAQRLGMRPVLREARTLRARR